MIAAYTTQEEIFLSEPQNPYSRSISYFNDWRCIVDHLRMKRRIQLSLREAAERQFMEACVYGTNIHPFYIGNTL